MLSDGQETSKGTIFAKYVLRPIIASSVVYYSNLKKIYESLVKIFSSMINSNSGKGKSRQK